MGQRLLTLYVEGQPRRYTTRASPQVVGGETYQPGLQVGATPVHGLATTTVQVNDPTVDWAALVLALQVPPQWRAQLAYADGEGAIPLQVGVARIGALTLEGILPLSINPATVPGARMVPDPSQATILADDYPSEGRGGAFYAQDESSIGATVPRVYGAPGLSAMESDANIGGPTTTAYRVEVGLGALYIRPARIVIASPPTEATTVDLYDAGSGQDEQGNYTMATVTPYTIADNRGREVQVVDLNGTVGMPVAAGSRFGLSWAVSSSATDRTANHVVRDLMEASGRPVDTARLRLPGLLLDVAIESPVDPVAWVLEQIGSVPLFVGRSWAGFYAALVPIDQLAADVALTLQPADQHTGIVPAEPGSVVSRVQVTYGPIDGSSSRRVLLTPDGAEEGATADPRCALAEAEGYDGTLEQDLPAVCDPATAARMAELLAAEYATPGPAVSVTVSDPRTMRRLMLRGPATLMRIVEDRTLDYPSLTGRYVAVDAMSVTDTTLTLTGTVRR